MREISANESGSYRLMLDYRGLSLTDRFYTEGTEDTPTSPGFRFGSSITITNFDKRFSPRADSSIFPFVEKRGPPQIGSNFKK